jgi:hypothetical protein
MYLLSNAICGFPKGILNTMAKLFDVLAAGSMNRCAGRSVTLYRREF